MNPSRNGTTELGPKKKGRNAIEKSPVKYEWQVCEGALPANGKSDVRKMDHAKKLGFSCGGCVFTLFDHANNGDDCCGGPRPFVWNRLK